MKKYLFAVVLFFTALSTFAQNTQLGLSYTGASHLTQVKAFFEQALALNAKVGLSAKVADEEIFKRPVSALYVPVTIGGEFISLNVTPFYYFKNKIAPYISDTFGNQIGQNSYAYGASATLSMTMQQDDLNDLYSNAYLGVSFARSQGVLFAEQKDPHHQYYSQVAFSAGLHRNFYRFLSFEFAGSAFEYPDGIKGVTGFYSVLDQQDLAYMQTFDIVHQLPKYTLSTRVTRLWTERLATIYLGYRFGEFYGADSQHSFMLGNTFAMTQTIQADLGYNHLRTIHNDNKRDIFYVRLSTRF